MHKVSKETLKNCFRPYDVVTDKDGTVGFIREVSINECQPENSTQIQYAVNWLVGDNNKTAWFDHSELKSHCNLFVKIAESSCHPMGHNKKWVKN